MANVISILKNQERDQIENWCRGKAQTVSRGDGTALCRVLGDYLVLVDARDLSVAPHLMMSGFWEIWITMFMARTIKPGWRCIDVGANLGYFSVVMSALSERPVQAWEPQRSLAGLIRGTSILNGMNIEVQQCAASDSGGHIRLTTHPVEGAGVLCGSGNVSSQVTDPFDDSICVVETKTIDSTSFAQSPVNFIKIDAEGHEPQVWGGMSNLRKISPDLRVLLEWSPKAYSDKAKFMSDIVSEGWKLHTIDSRGAAKPVLRETLLAMDDGFEMVLLTR
jgi:FkbM family methyltransferase